MKKHVWVSIFTIFLLTFITVAYASFSSVLTITGEATVAKDTTAPTCGSWYLRDSSLTIQEAYNQNKFINAGTNTSWSNTNKTLFIECTDNMEGEYGCINVDTVTTSGSGKRYFKDVKDYTTSVKTDSNIVTVTLKDAYMNERTCTLPVGGSNPYIDKEEPTVTITRSAANKFTYSATDNMSSSVAPQYMVTTSSTKPAINDANWSSTASEVTIDNSAAKTYYVWAKDGVNISSSTISTFLLTKTQGTGTSLTLKYNNDSGATLSTGYVLNGTQVYAVATPSTGYSTAVIKKDSTTVATGTGSNSTNATITVNAATTISSSATANNYTIAYTMNNGTDPNPKPTSGTYDSNVSIGTTSIPTKTVTITGNANGTGATVGAATVNALTFNGWSTSSGAGLQSNAQSGSTTSNFASWTGGTTTNKYFKNLRSGSGTVTLTANWSTTVTLPTVSKTGHTCSWTDSNGNEFGTTIAQNASTSITVYAKCTANTYNITLNQQSGSGGTGTIYEKYGDGYYLNNSSGTVSNKMSTTDNGVTVPTRSGYTFGGYYTGTNGSGTQYIDASGKLTSSASATQFSSAGNLYAKWTLNTPASPTISGGATKVYGSSATTLTCSNSTTYPSGVTKKYQFGYATSDGGSPGNWTTESDSNTLTIAANAYVEQRWYSCRVRVYDGSAYSGYATSSTSADTEMTINNATLTFDANNGTGGGIVYTKTGQNVVYDGIRSTSTTSIPTTSRPGYTFLGWYDAPSGGNKVLNADGSFTGTAVSGYTSTNTWVATTDKTLYAYWNGISYNITLIYNGTQFQEFGYVSNNTYQEFTFPYTGTYQLEAWGAQGGSSVNDGVTSSRNLYGDFLRNYNGGLGSYTKGNASFNQGENIYIYVGQQPLSNSGGKTDNYGGFNGGGTGRWDRKDNDAGGGGGGATDFRYFGNDTPVLATVPITPTTAVSSNAQISLRYRIMVAAGGGGRGWSSFIGHGGGIRSVEITGNTLISSQTNQINTSSVFGRGGTGGSGETSVGTGGGGGGYWGGFSGNGSTTSGARPGNGGSSYVSGYTGCIAVASSSSNAARTGTNGANCTEIYTQDKIYYPSTDNLCSVHFTGKTFTDIDIISGDSAVEAAKEDPKSFVDFYHYRDVDGNYGDGHARISLSSIPKGVTSGQPIGSLPLPFGDTYIQKFVDDDNYDDDTYDAAWWTDLFVSNNYEVEYEIKWFDKEENPIDETTIYDPTMGNEFYAHGVPKEYSITYNLDGGSWPGGVNPNPLTYNGTQEFEPTAPIDHKIENGTYYEFVRWETTHYSQSGLQYTSSGIEKGDRGDKTFTAIWEAKSAFTVTYDANGGTTTCTNLSGMYGDTWTLCTTPPTRGDTQFLGWFTAPSGGTQITTGGTYGEGPFEGSYILYAHWDIKAIEYDYNIEQLFTENSMMDTYYKPDWSKTFEFEITVRPSWASKRYLLIGNYDTTSQNSLNIELTANNQVKVYVGTGFINANFGSVPIGASSTIKVRWEGSTNIITVDVSGAGTGHYENYISDLSGIANRNMRIGSMDYRQISKTFSRINIQGLVIREYYTPPLQETVVAPDPAGHYLLFDGWTGANGTIPEYEVNVPLNSTSLVHYDANWSPGVSRKLYSKTFSTSNKYIKFKTEVVVQYIDQARRVAYTRERVNFFRTNSGYNTYGHGSMTVRYNWNAALQDFTVATDGKKINERGINMWSEYWDDSGNSFRSIPYLNGGTRSVSLSVRSFTHAIFDIDTPKTATFNLPPIKSLN